MNERIGQLVEQIKQLELELTHELQQHQQALFVQLEGKKIQFTQGIKQIHCQLKVGVWRWLLGVRPLNIITTPIIYSMIVPLVLSDLCVSFYQATCFPIYNITKVRRRDYIVFDHHHLAYLNIIERMHCNYCSYANGLIAYIHEILSRTEQYFCPIKHAHTLLGTHHRYTSFLLYGDADNYHQKLEVFRDKLAKEK